MNKLQKQQQLELFEENISIPSDLLKEIEAAYLSWNKNRHTGYKTPTNNRYIIERRKK